MSEQKEPTATQALILGLVIGSLLGWFACGLVVSWADGLDSKQVQKQFQTEAIERGFAEHDAKTGEWRWREGAK